MVVDGSKLVRKLIGDTLRKELPSADVVGCAGLREARAALSRAVSYTHLDVYKRQMQARCCLSPAIRARAKARC